MVIAPISSSSLSIGTATMERAPPSVAGPTDWIPSAALSAVWTHLLCPHDAFERLPDVALI